MKTRKSIFTLMALFVLALVSAFAIAACNGGEQEEPKTEKALVWKRRLQSWSMK